MRQFLVVATALLASCAAAEESPVEIPLKSIWAWAMPDTQPVTDLDPEVVKGLKKYPKAVIGVTNLVVAAKLGDKSLAYKFLSSMKVLRGKKGLAVAGDAAEALKKIASTPLDKLPDKLPAGNVTLVFCAPRTRDYVHVQKVSRSGNTIKVRYHLVNRDLFISGDSFALIPLGKLLPGEYDVHIDSPQRDRPSAQHVSKPFSFTVE